MEDQELDIAGDPSPEVAALFGDDPAPEETQPEETPAEQPETPAEEADLEEAVEEAGQQPEGEDPFASFRDDKGLILGKYKTPDEAFNAYRHMESYTTRVNQERSELAQEHQKLQEAVHKARPIIQELLAQREAQQQQPQVSPDDIDWLDPQQREQYIAHVAQLQAQQAIQQAVGPIQAEQQQQFQAQMEEQHRTQMRNEFVSWQSQNPDVQPNTPMWTAMNNVLHELQYDDETGQLDTEQFPINSTNLTIAKTLAVEPQVFDMAKRLQFIPSDDEDMSLLRDASSNPDLATVLVAQPALVETREGHQWARRQAVMPGVVSEANNQAATAQTNAAQAERNAAYVERETQGAPADAAPGSRPDDVKEALKDLGFDLWKQERSFL